MKGPSLRAGLQAAGTTVQSWSLSSHFVAGAPMYSQLLPQLVARSLSEAQLQPAGQKESHVRAVCSSLVKVRRPSGYRWRDRCLPPHSRVPGKRWPIACGRPRRSRVGASQLGTSGREVFGATGVPLHWAPSCAAERDQALQIRWVQAGQQASSANDLCTRSAWSTASQHHRAAISTDDAPRSVPPDRNDPSGRTAFADRSSDPDASDPEASGGIASRGTADSRTTACRTTFRYTATG